MRTKLLRNLFLGVYFSMLIAAVAPNIHVLKPMMDSPVALASHLMVLF